MSACKKKKSYSSRAEANRVMFLQTDYTKLRVYHCPDCSKWHLTSKPLKESK